MSGMHLYEESPALTTIQDIFERIIDSDVPYCTGTVQLDASQSLLFYRSNDESRFIDFANPAESQLRALSEACSPASFGRNQEDVLDENYRKAGKMDSSDFAAQFSPWDSGIFKTVVDTLFEANESVADVTYELYKLNVYGPGSFFKSHVDTPRSDMMFGSLVVVLPTHHTGGSLLFRHHGQEYMFDSASTVSVSPIDKPHAAFAAFFSDVEHEVTEVTSGYRVTLTYNLYYSSPDLDSDDSSGIMVQNLNQTLSSLRNAFTSLLSAPSFLPDGGLLAFGLSYEYPFNPDSTELSDIREHLKGTDALLKRVCDALELEVSMKALYYDPKQHEGDVYCFMDRFISFEEEQIEQNLNEYLRYNHGYAAVVGYDALSEWRPRKYTYDPEVLGVVWARPLEKKNEFREQYIAYGNEASMGCAYGTVCLVVRIKPASERE